MDQAARAELLRRVVEASRASGGGAGVVQPLVRRLALGPLAEAVLRLAGEDAVGHGDGAGRGAVRLRVVAAAGELRVEVEGLEEGRRSAPHGQPGDESSSSSAGGMRLKERRRERPRWQEDGEPEPIVATASSV